MTTEQECEECRVSNGQSAGYYPRCVKHEEEYRDKTASMPRKQFYQQQWDERNPDRAGQYPDWIAKLKEAMKIGDWSITGDGKETVAVQGGDELTRLESTDDGVSIDSGGGLIIPDEVLAEWLRRKGWTVTAGEE